MNDDRFEDWWVSNPAREALNPVAKEVARGVWRAARADMAAEIQETVAQTPDPTFKEMSDALWVSQLGVVEPEPRQREMWESASAFEQRVRDQATGRVPLDAHPDKGEPC